MADNRMYLGSKHSQTYVLAGRALGGWGFKMPIISLFLEKECEFDGADVGEKTGVCFWTEYEEPDLIGWTQLFIAPDGKDLTKEFIGDQNR